MEHQQKLYEDILPVVNSPYWVSIQALIDTLIESKRESLERVQTFEEVLKIRGSIEAFREIRNLKDATESFIHLTNPQSRGRELYVTKPE